MAGSAPAGYLCLGLFVVNDYFDMTLRRAMGRRRW
jgi:hypothetical protein